MSAPAQERAAFLRAVPAAGTALPGRVYLGDEFCERRLPSDELLDWAAGPGRPALTLMTPYLSDAGVARLEQVLARLRRAAPPSLEVVVNDLGTLELLRRGACPGAAPVCGRLLSSRYMFFNDFPEDFLEFLETHGMRRVELNSVSQLRETQALLRERGLRTHFHWPYMFLTTTRFCPTDRGFAGDPRESIAACGRGCGRFLGTSPCPDGSELILYGNAYLVRHAGLPAPPVEADRIVEAAIPLEASPR